MNAFLWVSSWWIKISSHIFPSALLSFLFKNQNKKSIEKCTWVGSPIKRNNSKWNSNFSSSSCEWNFFLAFPPPAHVTHFFFFFSISFKNSNFATKWRKVVAQEKRKKKKRDFHCVDKKWKVIKEAEKSEKAVFVPFLDYTSQPTYLG